MAKFELRIRARKLRREGKSVKKIAKNLNVSKSSVSIWTRDIILSKEQLEKLRKSMVKGAELGRINSALIKKEKRLSTIERLSQNGIDALKGLTQRELLIAGICLYWGEGSKKSDEFSFCNSDPEMLKFFLIWLKKCFEIESKDLKCSIGINVIHIGRENKVKKYWVETLGVKEDQFTKTSFKKTKNSKVYENFNDHYGTIRIRIRKPGELYYKIIGMIDGLKYNMPG